MTTKTHNIASFVLRFTQELWQDATGEPHVRWRGHIRHVQGDEENRFTDFAEAVAFIQHYLTQLTVDSLAGGKPMSQEKVFRESFKLWEQFASSYTDMMVQAMEQSMKQSETFREQVDEAREQTLKAWSLSPSAETDQPDLIEAVQKLHTRLDELVSRMDKLEEKLSQQENGSKTSKA